MTDTQDLRSTLKGVVDANFDGQVTQYRGIQYATIAKRFSKPVLNTKWTKTKDCTKFGPRCPQVPADYLKFMSIPKDIKQWGKDTEDELRCDNLTISCPSDTSLQKLPVLLWIHGGAQVISVINSSQMLGNTNPLVAQSIEIGKPIVVVAINYRLNIFAFGDREGELNLDLQDQRTGIEWTKKNISTFGGDPDNITVAGESAGAIYIHALLASGTDVQRAILHSGSLFTTPPRSDKQGLGLVGVIEGNLALIEIEKGNMNPGESPKATVAGAPADRLVTSLKDLQINSKWMWEEKSLKDWQQVEKTFGKLKGLMIGDCQAEGVLWAQSLNCLSAANLRKAFEAAAADAGRKVADAYGITGSDDAASRKAAIQFAGDLRFNWAAHDISQRLRHVGVDVHRFIFDQVNPFAKQNAVAHHDVDLFAVFGGYDDVVGDEMKAVGKQLRSHWISFVHGEPAWSTNETFAYGPNGKTEVINDEQVAQRRRVDKFDIFKEVGFDSCVAIWTGVSSAAEAALASQDPPLETPST